MKRAKLTVDIAMAVLLPLLMAYSLIGEAFHEIIGTAMLALGGAHHVLNRRWYGVLLKGKYNPRRVFQAVLDLLLIAVLVLQPLSGIAMSKHLYTFLPALPLSAAAREIHMLCAYWGFVLMSLHAGTHLLPVAAKLKKQKGLFPVICLIAAAVSICGVYAFIKRGFPGYMAGTTKFAFFDYNEPLGWFLLDHLAVMALFMTVGAVLATGLAGKRPKSPTESITRRMFP